MKTSNTICDIRLWPFVLINPDTDPIVIVCTEPFKSLKITARDKQVGAKKLFSW